LIDLPPVLSHDVHGDIAQSRDETLRFDGREPVDQRRVIRDDGDQHCRSPSVSRRHLAPDLDLASHVTGDGVGRQGRQLRCHERHRRIPLIGGLSEGP
jgi:hypothetical protein